MTALVSGLFMVCLRVSMVPLSSRGTPALLASCLKLAKKSLRLSPCLSLHSFW